VYQEWQFLRLCQHTGIVGRQHQLRGTVGENQHWQQEIIIHWEGLFWRITELLQHRWRQNWIFNLKNLFPQKVSNMSVMDPTSVVRLQLLNLWLLKVILRFVNNGVMTINPGHQITGAWAWYGQMSHPSCHSLHQEKFMFGELPWKPTMWNA
jgi:hypothetical protein